MDEIGNDLGEEVQQCYYKYEGNFIQVLVCQQCGQFLQIMWVVMQCFIGVCIVKFVVDQVEGCQCLIQYCYCQYDVVWQGWEIEYDGEEFLYCLFFWVVGGGCLFGMCWMCFVDFCVGFYGRCVWVYFM